MLSIDTRPKTLKEFQGQTQIIKEFRERIKKNDIPEVMLFSGSSGCGKTTLAYIIANIISNGIIKGETLDADPNSKTAESIYSNNFDRDVIFKDASSMSKDDVINLQEELSYMPLYDKKRVFIIDEAQNLGRLAKGAVLTLLEKKRKNVYLILCTMDETVFDKAVISRCSKFSFKQFNSVDIFQYLQLLADKLEVPMNTEMEYFWSSGLKLIAESAEGSMRQAVQNLDRCIAGNIYSQNEIESEFAILNNENIFTIINKIINKNPSFWVDLENLGEEEFYKVFYSYLINILIYKYSGYLKNENAKYNYDKLLVRIDIDKIVDIMSDPYIYNNGYFQKSIFKKDLVKAFYCNEIKKNNKRIPVGD